MFLATLAGNVEASAIFQFLIVSSNNFKRLVLYSLEEVSNLTHYLLWFVGFSVSFDKVCAKETASKPFD